MSLQDKKNAKWERRIFSPERKLPKKDRPRKILVGEIKCGGRADRALKHLYVGRILTS